MLCGSYAQNENPYRLPSALLTELVNPELPPAFTFDNTAGKTLFLYRNRYKSIGELAEKEVKLAGLAIDPEIRISTTVTYYHAVQYGSPGSDMLVNIKDLPPVPRMAWFVWSPDKNKIAFTNTTENGVELWYYDFKLDKTFRVIGPSLNATAGRPYSWYPDGNGFLVKLIPSGQSHLPDRKESALSGPVTYYNDSGEKSLHRTYANLLKDRADEEYFTELVASELWFIPLEGKGEIVKEKGLYIEERFSPDGNYLLIKEWVPPFSYSLPATRFPVITGVYTPKGELVKEVDKKPLIEKLPGGFMAVHPGKRSIAWRGDKAATLWWVEALDGGDPSREAEYRDQLWQWHAPFTDGPEGVAQMPHRFANVLWGNDSTAILYSYWRNTRTMKTFLIRPGHPGNEPLLLHDRNYQDQYSDPGNFEQEYNEYNELVLKMDKNALFLVGNGYMPEGKFPFVDRLDLMTMETTRLYQSDFTDKDMDIVDILDPGEKKLLVRMESPVDYPNYYFLQYGEEPRLTPLTSFKNPFKGLEHIRKEIVYYKRSDSLSLSGILYLPEGYEPGAENRLPLVMWAYPRDYTDKRNAGQNTVNAYSFNYPGYNSPVFWVKKGYAVFDEVAFPIVGEGDKLANDTYVEQLVDNAHAAISALDSMGIIDPSRVAVIGHSYGAFMVANLLTHSDLFAAGIALSGAYNRTLTPFGFQEEERTYWEAPEVYHKMSPFLYADRMKSPLLLVHGREDENVGTPVLQSERYYEALKSLGSTVKLVVFPYEGHTFRAQESILHLLWEEEQWLDKYLGRGE